MAAAVGRYGTPPCTGLGAGVGKEPWLGFQRPGHVTRGLSVPLLGPQMLISAERAFA